MCLIEIHILPQSWDTTNTNLSVTAKSLSCWSQMSSGVTLSYFEIIQRRGEVIFVPSGWHHQVENVEDTISINHNWFNGSNINFIWNNLVAAFRSAEAEISDCKEGSTEEEFSKMCQSLLRASHGMNFEDFFRLLKIVATKRITYLTSLPTADVTERATGVIFDGWKLGRNHTVFDLRQIHAQLTMIKAFKDSCFLERKIQNLLNEISFVLDNK